MNTYILSVREGIVVIKAEDKKKAHDLLRENEGANPYLSSKTTPSSFDDINDMPEGLLYYTMSFIRLPSN